MIRNTLVAMFLMCPLVAEADLTLTGRSMVGSFGTTLAQEERLRIRDTWLRRDFTDRGKAYSHVYDFAKRQIVVMDHSFRTAEVHDIGDLSALTTIHANASSLDLKVTRTQRTQALRNWTCSEHVVSARMPALLGSEQVTFVIEGTAWLASGVPEQASVKALVQVTQDPAFFLGVPATVRMAPIQARSISEIIRHLAPKGLLCGGTVDFTFEGDGPMANLARKMPGRLGIQYQAFSSEPISRDAFTIPESYRVIRR